MPRRKKSTREAKETRLRIGPVQQKILLLLLGGLALSCAKTPRKQWQIIKGVHASWKEVTKRAAEYAINKLYESRLLEARENADGTTTLVLNDTGKKKALTYKAGMMKIEPKGVWDGKWRMVVFDIPEDEREKRDAMRDHLEDMGFFVLQRSVFVHPLDCRNEVDFLIELHSIRKYVRFLIVEYIDNEAHLKRFFKLD